MNFPCPLDAFDDIARLIMGAVFLPCFGAVWCYKTETSKNGEFDYEEITCHRIGNVLCCWLNLGVGPRSRRRSRGQGGPWGGRRR